MGQLIQQTIKGLEKTSNEENFFDSISFAGDLLARFHTNNNFKSGFKEIDAEPITAQDAENLKQALLKALNQCDDLATQGSIIWALKRTRDNALKPLYDSYLENALQSLEGGSCLISECLDGLHYLGGDVYERDATGSTTQSPFDTEKNQRQARTYFAKTSFANLVVSICSKTTQK